MSCASDWYVYVTYVTTLVWMHSCPLNVSIGNDSCLTLQTTPGGYQGLPRVTKGYHGLPWVTIGYYGLPWVTNGYQGVPRGTKGYQGVPKVTTGYDGLPRVTTGYHGLPRVTTGYQWLPWVTKGAQYPLHCALLTVSTPGCYISHFYVAMATNFCN